MRLMMVPDNIQVIYTLNGKPSDESFVSFQEKLTDQFLTEFFHSKETTKQREKAIKELN